MLHTPGTISQNDPIVNAVRGVMKENDVRRSTEVQLNKDMGIASVKQLPASSVPDYKLQLETRVQAALTDKKQLSEETINELSPKTLGSYFAKAQTTHKKTGDSYKRIEGRGKARAQVGKKTGKDIMHYAHPEKSDAEHEEETRAHIEKSKKVNASHMNNLRTKLNIKEAIDSASLKRVIRKCLIKTKPLISEPMKKLRSVISDLNKKNASIYNKFGPGQNESVEIDEKVTNAQTAALTNKLTAGMTKKQANRVDVGQKINIDGSNYTAVKGDSRWRIAQRHLRAGEAQAGTRNKDDNETAPAPKATPTTRPRPSGSITPPVVKAGAGNSTAPTTSSRTRSGPPVKRVGGSAGPVKAGAGNSTAPTTSSRTRSASLNTALIAKEATSRQQQTGDKTLVSRNIGKPNASSILGTPPAAPKKAPAPTKVTTTRVTPSAMPKKSIGAPIRPAGLTPSNPSTGNSARTSTLKAPPRPGAGAGPGRSVTPTRNSLGATARTVPTAPGTKPIAARNKQGS